MITVSVPDKIKVHHGTSIRYAKSRSHWLIRYHDNGVANTKETSTRRIKSFANNTVMFVTVAPNTFLMATSCVRCVVMKEDKPKSPMQAIKIASPEDKMKIFQVLSSP